MSTILVIDNYDSFVWTIVGYLEQLGAQPVVERNDAVTVDPADVDGVLVSPGPGTPKEAGVTLDEHRHAIACLGRYGSIVNSAEFDWKS